MTLVKERQPQFNSKIMKIKPISLTIILFLSLEIKAQDFQAFINNFQATSLPFAADKAVLDACKKGPLKAIPLAEIKKYILQNVLDSSNIYNFQLLAGYEEKELDVQLKNRTYQLYYFKKLPLSTDYQSVLVYFVNDKDQNGLREWKIVLLNFTPNGKLINSFNFADEEIFMSYRINTAKIDADLNIIRTERDFEASNTRAAGKPTYEIDHHFALQKKDMSVISTQKKFYPYLGEFVSDAEVMSIDQNKNHFYITLGKINANVATGLNVKSYHLKEGTFEVEIRENEIWKGKFNPEKTQITITKPDQSTILFLRKY